MKKGIILMMTLILGCTSIFAYEGEMGYFGGITPGEKLPKSTVLAAGGNTRQTRITLPYKETLYLTGKPVTVEGTIEVRPQVIDKTKPNGKYRETYTIRAEDVESNSRLTRNLVLDTTYYYDPMLRQTTKTSTLSRWTELAVLEGRTYQLDVGRSSFSKSMVEDHTPGVTYYRGDVAYEAVYRDVAAGNNTYITMRVDGPIYGYEHAYSKTETQRREIYIENGQDTYVMRELNTFTTNKDLQYSANEPWVISFGGNYREVLSGQGSSTYTIEVGSPGLYDDERVGYTTVGDVPSLEQLQAFNLTQLKGHPAESDVRKMYSMRIFTGDANRFSPNQVVTRGEYIKMLVNAMRLPLPEAKRNTGFGGAKKEETVAVFNDLREDHALYPYAMAAYEAGLISGGNMNPGKYLTREEMLVMNIRLLGLERLGLATPGSATTFQDDAQIAPWAKSSVYAASTIGLVPDTAHYLLPKKRVTYAEVAAFINQMLEYLRYDLEKDYNQKMMP